MGSEIEQARFWCPRIIRGQRPSFEKRCLDKKRVSCYFFVPVLGAIFLSAFLKSLLLMNDCAIHQLFISVQATILVHGVVGTAGQFRRIRKHIRGYSISSITYCIIVNEFKRQNGVCHHMGKRKQTAGTICWYEMWICSAGQCLKIFYLKLFYTSCAEFLKR